MIKHKLSAQDKQLIQEMRDALAKYIHAARLLSWKTWNAIHEANTRIGQDVVMRQVFFDEGVFSGVVELDEFER